MTIYEIISAARSQIGTPFMHQGRIPGKALDCAGLGAYVCQQVGVAYSEWPGYGRVPVNNLLKTVLDAQPCLRRVQKTEMQAGDILLMRFIKEPQHIAVFAGDTIIHSFEAAGQVCEHILSDEWRRRIVGVYRFIGLE